METLWQDIRQGLRGFLKHPGFTAIIVITLAIGIGASTTMFSVVNTVLLRRLPYPNADRVVAIQELGADGKRVQVTAANFLDWRAQNTVFQHLAAIKSTTANLLLADQAERISLAVTSANFFDVLGAQPQYGRLFNPEDEQAGHQSIVVIGDSLWRRQFSTDPNAVGKAVTLDGKTYTIVGIAPNGFQYPDKTEAWLPPLRLAPELNETMDVTQARGMGYLSAVALLKPGVSLAQAGSEMEAITARLREQFPHTNNNRFNRVVSLHDHLIGETHTMLWLLFGAVTFVLVIACANVANLLLANAASRQKEISIRVALGASRWRVVQQVLTESTMLALVGGAVGLLLSFWGLPLITRLLPQDFPRLQEIAIDWRVLSFSLVASVMTGILFGLAPALQSLKADIQEAIKEGGRGTSSGIRKTRLRSALIVSEVALSVVLLAGAGLLFRTFLHLQAVNTGFAPQHVMTFRLSPSGANYRRDADYTSFYDRTVQRISAIPGVEAVGTINTLPLAKGPTFRFRIEGRAALTPDKWPAANYRIVSPDYFRAMNVPLLQGRPFTEQDREGAPLVALINEAIARRDFGNENPLGKRVSFGGNGPPIWFEIVGVVANVRNLELRDEPAPEIYLSYLQDQFQGTSFVIRSAVQPASLMTSVRQAVQEVDKSVPVADIQTMDDIVSEAVAQPRFNLFLLGLFGCIALALSGAGIYAVTAYTVTQRTHELGIRLALGAQVGDVLRMILRQGMVVISAGMLLGLVVSFGLMRLLKSLLFGVSATDPLTFVGITLVLMLVALLACYIPARRATKVDPLIALRYE
jgi:predicted permease